MLRRFLLCFVAFFGLFLLALYWPYSLSSGFSRQNLADADALALESASHALEVEMHEVFTDLRVLRQTSFDWHFGIMMAESNRYAAARVVDAGGRTLHQWESPEKADIKNFSLRELTRAWNVFEKLKYSPDSFVVGAWPRPEDRSRKVLWVGTGLKDTRGRFKGAVLLGLLPKRFTQILDRVDLKTYRPMILVDEEGSGISDGAVKMSVGSVEGSPDESAKLWSARPVAGELRSSWRGKTWAEFHAVFWGDAREDSVISSPIYLVALLPEKTASVNDTRRRYTYTRISLVAAVLLGLASLLFAIISEKSIRSERKARLTSRYALLGEMAGGTAHEINNPLAVIQGRVVWLIAQLDRRIQDPASIDPGRIRKALMDVGQAADRIAAVVEAFLRFSRDASKDPLERCRPIELVESAIRLFEGRFSRAGVELEWKSQVQSEFLECRRSEMHQVLASLLSNAFEAVESASERKIQVELLEVDGRLLLRVCDSGRGVPEALRQRIFEPFFSSKIKGGMGLGLSLSRSIVEGLGGSLEVERLSGPTCFLVRLPLKQ